MNLVQILFAFVIAYIKGEHPIKELSDTMSRANQATLLKLMPGLAPLLDAYNSGHEIDWTALSELVAAFRKAYLIQPEAKSSYADVLGAFASWFKSGSVGAFKKLEKISTQVRDPAIPQAFIKEDIDQGPIKDQLLRIVKKMGGSGEALTVDQSKAAKSKKPDLYKAYLALRRQYSESWKTALSNYIRSAGKTTVPMKEIEAYFASLGIEHNMAKGFTGNIDAKGAWYTSDGKLIQGVPAAAMFPTVNMNPKPKEANWIFQAVRPDGELGNQFYTEEYKRSQAQHKFAVVADFNPEKYKGRWRAMITNFDYYNSRDVAAVVIEILYRSSNRIGGKGNKDGGGLGIATLLKKHYYPQTDGGFKFIYLGKDNVKFTVKMSPTEDAIAKKVCEIVHEMANKKRPSDQLFTYWLKSGNPKPLSTGTVREIFTEITGTNVHKLRTYKGTTLFREYLANVFSKRASLDQGQAMDIFRKGAVLVGTELNHVKRTPEGVENVTPSTAIKNYIDPEAQAELFQHYGLPLPSYLEKLLGQSTLAKVYHVHATDTTQQVKPVQPTKPTPQATQPAPAAPTPPVKPVEPVKPSQPSAPVSQPAPPPQPPQPQQPQPQQTPPAPVVQQPAVVPQEDDEPAEIHIDPIMESFLAGDTDVWR